MEYQIKQTYGNGGFGYLYFTSDSTEVKVLEKLAIAEARKDWERVRGGPYFIVPPKPPRPTIVVAQYANRRVVKGGIKFKTKWV